jgi:hypothetical protein
MKRILSALILLALAATLEPRVYADSGCSNATLTGNYSFNFGGWFPTVDKNGRLILPNSTITNSVGVVEFDGAGNTSASFTACNNGTCAKVHGKGTYSVNSDCSGKFVFGKGKNATPWSLAIANGGSQVYAVETDIANVSGTAIKQ